MYDCLKMFPATDFYVAFKISHKKKKKELEGNAKIYIQKNKQLKKQWNALNTVENHLPNNFLDVQKKHEFPQQMVWLDNWVNESMCILSAHTYSRCKKCIFIFILFFTNKDPQQLPFS